MDLSHINVSFGSYLRLALGTNANRRRVKTPSLCGLPMRGLVDAVRIGKNQDQKQGCFRLCSGFCIEDAKPIPALRQSGDGPATFVEQKDG